MPKFKNILLVNPWQGEVFPSPAIGYLQSAIKNYFIDKVYVIAADIDKALILLSKPNNFDLIAASFHSFSVKYANIIRELTIGKTLICGGHHPSSMPEQLINIGYDCVIVGEGENSIIDFIKGNIKSKIFYSSNANKYYNNINEIPEPDYTGLDIVYNKDFGFPIISSRGCPFKCSFCASSLFWKRTIQIRNAENVLTEIENSITKYKHPTFMFEDDNFTIIKSRVVDICNGIVALQKKLNIPINWQCASRADVLTDTEICLSLKNSGCHTVWLGIESFSQETLNRCIKNTTVDKMVAGITNAENNGLRTMCQFIIGLPSDNLNNIMETVNVISKTKISRLGCNIAWILPNTDIHKEALLRGFNNESYINSGVEYYTYEQTMDTLIQWQNLINNAK